jgi:hypothetical protein
MIRAAFATILVGLAVLAWFMIWMWLYRKLADTGPEWLSLPAGRNMTVLETGGLIGFIFTAAVLAAVVGIAMFRLFRVPDETFLPGDNSREGYLFHRRRLSQRARARPGQEGFMDEKLSQLDQFSRSPLTPPARKKD